MTQTIKTKPFSMMIVVILILSALMSMPTSQLPVGDFVVQAVNYGKVDKEVMAELAVGVTSSTIASRYSLTVVKALGQRQWLFKMAKNDRRTVDQVVTAMRADAQIVWAEGNYYVKAPEIDQRSASYIDQRSIAYIDGQSPSDYFTQYAVSKIKADLAHAYSTGSGVTVAVIDTGVDINHPVFHSTVPGYDFVGRDNNPAEEGSGPGYGHGTFVAGIIALVAPNATIMPIRAFDSNGSAKAADLNDAIIWAVNNGADVINMSWGLGVDSNLLSAAISFADSFGVVMIAAAGNEGTTSLQWPAAESAVLAVGATDQNDNRASFSNYGNWLGVGAPGVGIYSAYPNNRWAWWDGTSFSTAFVSGEAALVISDGGSNVTQTIKNTARSCCSNQLGSGRIDCLAAVN
jgi:thermitase